MDDPHGASGASLPNRTARRVGAIGLVVCCALVQAAARGDEPGVLRALPPVTDAVAPGMAPRPLAAANPTSNRLPSIVDQQPPPTFLYGFEDGGFHDPFAIRQVDYISGDAGTDQYYTPSVAMRSARSLLQEPSPETETSQQGDGEDGEGGEGGDGEENPDEQTYGQAPTNNALQFLRQVDVLLKPGAWQFDTGFIYTLFANDFPLPIITGGQVTNVFEAQVRRRLLWTPLAVRYGFRKNIQLFAAMPAGFSNTQLTAPGLSETRNVSGIGDLTAGATVHLLKGEGQMPDLIGTFAFTAPSGKFDTPLFGLVPGSNLGQGFWGLAGQGLFINRYDPVIVFYGGGYRHLFERTFDGILFAPGEQINYMLGVGFSVNDRVTLSSTFQGFYITNTAIQSVDVRGSNLEPISLRCSATIVRNCRIIEPFVQFGLTDSAPRVNAGVVVTFY